MSNFLENSFPTIDAALAGPQSSLSDMQARTQAAASDIDQFIPARQCLSCGAFQRADRTLPCDH